MWEREREGEMREKEEGEGERKEERREGVLTGKVPMRWIVREIGRDGRERERESGREEREVLIWEGRVVKVSVVAEGSVWDWVVRWESRPIIGVAVVVEVVVISATSVMRIKVVVDGMVTVVMEAFGCFGFERV